MHRIQSEPLKGIPHKMNLSGFFEVLIKPMGYNP